MNDRLVDAINMMIDMCTDRSQYMGMVSVREMLCNINEEEWCCMNEEERKELLSRYMCSCREKEGSV